MNQSAAKLGKYLKQKRSRRGLTQFEVARKLGYTSAQFISNMERGCCFPPNRVLKGMVPLYKIRVNELLSFLTEIDSEKWKKVLKGKNTSN